MVKKRAPRDSKKDALKILFLGDVFLERYIWPDPKPASFTNLPYTSPSMLRNTPFFATMREIGGAVAQESIVKSYLISKGQQVPCEVIPNREAFARILRDADDEPPLALVLHELSPLRASNEQGCKPTWRISRCFGMVRDATKYTIDTPPPEQSVTLPEPLIEATVDRLKKCVDESLTRSTILVLHDRDARDTSRNDPSARQYIGCQAHLVENLEQHANKKSKQLQDNLLILWHTRAPVFQDESGKKNEIYALIGKCNLIRNTIPVIHHICLQQAGLNLRFDLSYESTFRDVLTAFYDLKDPKKRKKNAVLRHLLEFPHVLIRFENGVLHLSSDGTNLTGLDLHSIPSQTYRVESESNGTVTGTTPLLLATICHEVAEFSQNTKDFKMSQFLRECEHYRHPTISNSSRLDRAIDTSLLLMNERMKLGFGFADEDQGPLLDGKESSLHVFKEVFKACNAIELKSTQSPPNRFIVTEGIKECPRLSRLSVPQEAFEINARLASPYAISRVQLFQSEEISRLLLQKDTSVGEVNSTNQLLRAVVRYGLDVTCTLSHHPRKEPSIAIPFLALGSFLSVDSSEIDGLLAMRTLIAKYCTQRNWVRPLNIAIFGAPGSGKSTAVKSCIAGLEGIRYRDEFVCNLSQIESFEQLSRFFHRIEDAIEDGVIPLAFFDEFDSLSSVTAKPWFKFFLMPMQDGSYAIGLDRFLINKAVFVFAGGVNKDYKEFASYCESNSTDKGPDFSSRLKGFLNIHGVDLKGRSENATAVKVRRAVLLRAMLEKHMSQIFEHGTKHAQVSDQIIDGFMHVKRFKNGARSIEAIIEMSRVANRQIRFDIACLPSKEQLNLHVDAEEFFRYATKQHAQR